MYGAAAAGEPGIAPVISILGTELERAMTLLGTAPERYLSRACPLSRHHPICH
ncbi:alpha-hydroxy-acid oxidizing protein [Bradyrhizobium neotropicale]|uniref:alpha-hydroxy-acid oxidizing protein n=1 Tax=Bradyrhizobium neotropicale TaxID=1497615 RepID=UPI001AD65671|nr:hypothetical protein [Bradyrhizobium neotropicale]